MSVVKPKYQPKRRDYTELGNLLKDARSRLRDEDTGRIPSVEDMANQLRVTTSFVYQVEQGKRKPKDGHIGKWASVYGVNHLELWKCLHRIPMDLVAGFKEQPQLVPDDLFSQLTDDEKSDLIPFINFVRWKVAHPASDRKP